MQLIGIICRNHDKAIRQVCYHSRYPLFASSSADGSVIIYHGRVYEYVILIVQLTVMH